MILRQFPLVILALAVGCQGKPSKNLSSLTSTLDGRRIVAVIDGPAFIHPQNTGAEITFDSHKVTVDKERVLLDGAELVRLSEDAKEIEIVAMEGTISVSADGKTLLTRPMP